MLTLKELQTDETTIRCEIDPKVMDACGIDDGAPVRLTDWCDWGGYGEAYRGDKSDRNTGVIRVHPRMIDNSGWTVGNEITVEADTPIIYERKPANNIEHSDTIETPFGTMKYVTEIDKTEDYLDCIEWLNDHHKCNTTLNCHNCTGKMVCRVSDETDIAFLCDDCDACLYESHLKQARADDGPIAAHATHYMHDHD